MKEKLKNNKIDVYVSAFITLVVGLLFVIFPIGVESVFSIIIGVAVLVVAVAMLIGAIVGGIRDSLPGLIITLLLAFIGIWILLNPTDFARLIPIAVGIMIAIHGISGVVTSFAVRGMGVKTWYIMLIASLISIVLGFTCIFCAFGVLALSGIIMGIMLIVDSIMTFLVTIRSNTYRRNVYGDKVVDSKVIK